MTPDQKQCLGKLRQTLRTIASSQGIESLLWEHVADIDNMLERGKCSLGDCPQTLIDSCVRELSSWIESQEGA